MTSEHSWIQRIDDWRFALVVWLVFSPVTCFANLGDHGLISMEGIVAAGARDMLETGGWAVPVLYGETYAYKPALAYWMSAAAQALPGPSSEWILRAPFAVSGLLLGLVVMVVVGWRFGPRVGLLASMATTGTALFLEKVRLAEFDTPLAVGVGVAIAAASVNLSRERPGLGLWLVTYAGLAFGFLAKGAPALITFAPGLLLAAAWNGRLPSLIAGRHLAGVAFFGVATLSYLWCVVETGGPGAFDQPILEARVRTASWTAGAFLRTSTKPVLVLVAFLPWSLLVGATRQSELWRRRDARGALWRSGASFLVAGTAAFMAVPAHEMRYYLPLATALALVAALVLDECLSRPSSKLPLAALRGFLVLLGVSACLLATQFQSPGWPLLVAVFLLLGSVAAVRMQSSGATAAALLVTSSLLLAISHAYVWMPQRAAGRDLQQTAAMLRRHLPPGATVYVQSPADAASKHSSLYHYLGNRVLTFSADRRPPLGAFVIRPDPRPRSVVEGSPSADWLGPLCYQVAAVGHAGGVFRLLRTKAEPHGALGSEP